jgi:hypothetical protein
VKKTLVVVLDDEQNADVHEQFIKGLPLGSSVIFDRDSNSQVCMFDKNASSWNPPHLEEYNWMFLRHQQNWANDLLHARGHVFLNEIYNMLGLKQTKTGAILGWVYDKDSEGDNYVDFGCWDIETSKNDEGGIRLQFNATPILHLIDPV